MGTKITVIGAGSVGATIAYAMSNTDIASEIVLIDINKKKVEGEVLDIAQGTAFRGPITIVGGEYEDAADSDIVIITSGVGRKPGQSRIDLTQTNVNILKSITPEIVKYAPNAKYIIVSDPVDVLTYVFTKISGLPENQIIGSGTLLDTARLRATMSDFYKVNQRNCHAFVFGEHGDSSFVPWSCAKISGIPLGEYKEKMPACMVPDEEWDCEKVEEHVRTSGGQIIANKGATFYAIANSVIDLCKKVLSAYDSIACLSSMMHGEYGIDDVCLNVLTVVGPNGIKGKVEMPLTEEEVGKLQHSANVLKEVIAQIEI